MYQWLLTALASGSRSGGAADPGVVVRVGNALSWMLFALVLFHLLGALEDVLLLTLSPPWFETVTKWACLGTIGQWWSRCVLSFWRLLRGAGRTVKTTPMVVRKKKTVGEL